MSAMTQDPIQEMARLWIAVARLEAEAAKRKDVSGAAAALLHALEEHFASGSMSGSSLKMLHRRREGLRARLTHVARIARSHPWRAASLAGPLCKDIARHLREEEAAAIEPLFDELGIGN